MDYDDFKKRVDEHRRKNFDEFQKGFNRLMKEQGYGDDAFDKIMGGKPKKPGDPTMLMPPWSPEKSEQLAELFLDIFADTTDEDPRDIILRAMAVYRSFVKHAKGGGQVKFVKEGEKDRVLKVRLR